ncbi:MAG: mechanosensitive ion channel [archaeon YNP-WB-062]|jgi:small conductance mechanosensitive channel|nr:mechanosensitive ion channel [Candidatus Culexarchaeum yellowstonense]
MISIVISLLPLLYRLIAAVIIIVATYFITRLLSRILQTFFKGVEVEYVAKLADILKLLLYILVAIIVASIIAPEMQIFSILILLIGLALILMFYDELKNIGAELYLRYRGIVRKGDWIEIDGMEVHIVDFDAFGAWGETAKLERVFIPYTKIVNSIIINKLTLLGLVSRVQIIVPMTYDVSYVKSVIEKAVAKIKEELASEPEVIYEGSSENMHSFVVELRVINFRKLDKVVTAFEMELRREIPNIVVKA